MKSRPARYSPQYFSDIQSAFKPIGKAARKFSSLVQHAKRSIPLQRPNRAINTGFAPITTTVSIKTSINVVTFEQTAETALKEERDLERRCNRKLETLEQALKKLSENYSDSGRRDLTKQLEEHDNDILNMAHDLTELTSVRKDMILQKLRDGVSDLEQRARALSPSCPENTQISKPSEEFQDSCNIIVNQMSKLLLDINEMDTSLRKLNQIENGINAHKSLTENQANDLLKNLELTKRDLTARKGTTIYDLFQHGRLFKDNPKEILGYTKLTPDARKDILVAAIDKAREIEREASKFVDLQ